MFRLAVLAALIAAPVAAQQGDPPKRIRSIELRQGEACPQASSAEEVVVCRTIEDPYRIPSELRDEGAAQQPTNQSWVNRAATVDQVSRVAGGLPNTCSPVGTGGQTGCFNQQAQQHAASRNERAAAERASTGR